MTAQANVKTETAPLTSPRPIWRCKIGTREGVQLPPGSDLPMRRAVQEAFQQITGLDAEFIFSGWSAELTEPEMAVVENRLPSDAHYRETCMRDAAPELYEALAEWLEAVGADAVLRARRKAAAVLAKARGNQAQA